MLNKELVLSGLFMIFVSAPCAWATDTPLSSTSETGEPGVYFTDTGSTYCLGGTAIGPNGRIDKIAQPGQTIVISYADLGLKSTNLPAAITTASMVQYCSSGYVIAEMSYGVKINSDGSYSIQSSTCNSGNCSVFSVNNYVDGNGTKYVFPEFKSKDPS